MTYRKMKKISKLINTRFDGFNIIFIGREEYFNSVHTKKWDWYMILEGWFLHHTEFKTKTIFIYILN